MSVLEDMGVPQSTSENSLRNKTEDVTFTTKNDPDGFTGNVVGTTGTTPTRPFSMWQWRLILLLNIFISVLNGYDVSNVANIQAPVYKAFGHIELLPWVAVSYTMGAVALTPFLRKSIELFNIRILYSIFYLILMISCAVSGSAPNIQAVIIGRVLMGLGYIGIFQLNLSLVSLFADKKQATQIAGAVGLCWAVGLILGPFVSAGFAQNSSTTWRWAFYINLPFLAVLLGVVVFCFPSYTIKPSASLKHSLSEIDLIGGTLHCAVAFLLPCALIMSGSSWKWNSPSTIVSWVFLFAIFVAYITQQKFALFTNPKNRIFPADILAQRTAGISVLGASCAGMAYAVSLYYLPIFYAFTRNASPLQAAVHIIPFIGVLIATIIIASAALLRVGYYAGFFALSGILILVGASLMTTISATTHNGTILGYEALLAAGVGLIFSNAYAVANASLEDPQQRTSAAALFNMALFSGICLGLALAGSVYHNRGFSLLHKQLADFGLDDHQIREALSGVASPVLQSDQRFSAIVVNAVAQVVSELFYILVAAGAICLLGGLAMRWEKMDFDKPTVQVAEVER